MPHEQVVCRLLHLLEHSLWLSLGLDFQTVMRDAVGEKLKAPAAPEITCGADIGRQEPLHGKHWADSMIDGRRMSKRLSEEVNANVTSRSVRCFAYA